MTYPTNPVRKERSVRKEGKAPYSNYDAGKQAKQPKGSSIGIHDGPKGHVGTSFKQEAKKQSRPEHASEHHGAVAGIPKNTEGSELIEQGMEGHVKQSHGKSIGVDMEGGAEHHKSSHMGGEAHSFPKHEGESHAFSGTTKRGHHRVSGHPSAHMIGHRK